MARILVIDDNESLRELFQEILTMGGHEARGACTGAEALRQLRLLEFDMILTDVVMPDKDGLETIPEVRRDFPSVRVVAVSGGGNNCGLDYLRMATLLGANATLAKPVRAQELLGVVAEVLAAA